ncbi:MAG: ABC transporter permease [Bryobacterales bacterium]
MTNRIVRGNLFHRKTRTLMTILAVAVEVAMVLLILGLSDGLVEESAHRRRGIGADIIISSSSASTISAGGNGLPESLIAEIETMPEVALAAGTTMVLPTNLQTITGIDWERFERMAGGVRFLEGGPFEGPDDVIIDSIYAEQTKPKIGGTLRFLNHDFRLAGIVETGKMSRIFIPLTTMQKLMGWQDDLSQIYVRLKDSGQTEAVMARLKEKLPDYRVRSMEEFIAMFSAQTRDMASSFIGAIMGIAVSVGFLVVLLSMYTAVLDRTRDIGILKSLGASPAYIVNIFIRETLWMTAGGVVVGALITWAARAAVEQMFPLVTILTLNDHLVWAVAIAVVGSVGGALYPAMLAARKDPIAALSYD